VRRAHTAAHPEPQGNVPQFTKLQVSLPLKKSKVEIFPNSPKVESADDQLWNLGKSLK